MKYIKSIVVLFFLIGLPAGSWYFLQTGLDWRREKAKELVVKQDLKDSGSFTATQQGIVDSLLMGKTSLIKFSEALTNDDLELIKQFKDAFTFQSLLVKDSGEFSFLQTAESKSANYALIDTAMQVRQFYDGKDKATLVRIIEDIALLIPQPKARDIKMKNKQEK